MKLPAASLPRASGFLGSNPTANDARKPVAKPGWFCNNPKLLEHYRLTM
jgi:hypothetical protein